MVELNDKPKALFTIMLLSWLILLLSTRVSGMDLLTFTARFEKTTFESETIEAVKGAIFYQKGGRLTLEVNFPLNQIMLIDGKSMLIYYPDENKGFRIESRFPFSLPLIGPVLLSLNHPSELSKLGFKLLKYEEDSGKLYTYWEPPKGRKKELGLLILGVEGEKLFYTETQGSDGRPLLRTWYHKHIEYKGRFIPVDFSTEREINGRGVREHIVFSDVKLNSPIPERVLNFRIPEAAKVKEIRW